SVINNIVLTDPISYQFVSSSIVESGILGRNRTETETATATQTEKYEGYKEYSLTIPISYNNNGYTYSISKLRVFYQTSRTRNATVTRTRTSNSWGLSWGDWSQYSTPVWSQYTAMGYRGTLSEFRNSTNNFVTI